KYSGENQVIFEKFFKAPSTVNAEVWTERNRTGVGAIVEPEMFNPGTKRPRDFNQFWKAEKKALKALPMKVQIVPVKNIEEGWMCSDIEINCTGPKPARGYFAKPENAGSGTLPIVLFVHAAGVSGSWCLSKPETAVNYAKMGKGALAFDLNAHGMLNGQDMEYYRNLENGELKNYYHQGLEGRNDNYFKGMYLRLMRTLDFLCGQPEWDGKRILVIGESQGGGQALVAAGLDHRVSAVVATVPAMCNFYGTFKNAIGGWPDPMGTDNDKAKMLETIPYFDAAHILKGSKATIVAEIGLIDVTCPSYSVYAAINQAKGEKIILPVPYRWHQMNSFRNKDQYEIWDQTVNKVKQDFINEFLK
ncbi:MAG: acetylxylan esterase, partial [Prolixibacteraceae bacterium]|nr:acetylxylan esterase [Prolixibacteraceae bacterium]